MSTEGHKFNFKNLKGKQNILLCCTGSVASIKIPILIDKLKALSHSVEEDIKPLADSCKFTDKTNGSFEVRLVTTEHAKHFFDSSALGIVVYEDQDEWDAWKKRTDPVLHIELRRWADIMLIAPLDANTLAKLSNGICDNLLTSVARAWDLTKPIAFAPAMNTHMWDHPLTSKHINMIKDLGYIEIPCVEKTLVCGDKGMGAMAEPDTIVAYVKDLLTSKQ